MIKDLCVKQGFLTFLFISLGIATLKLLTESSHYKKSVSTLGGYFEYVAENNTENKNTNDTSDLKSSAAGEKQIHWKTVTRNPGNILSKCGYNVCYY